MSKRIISIGGIVAIAAIILAVNLIVGLTMGRAKLDMTQDKLFTLSSGSVNIVKGLPEKVKAQLFYSRTAMDNVPQFKTYAERIIGMLKEFQSASGGKLALEIIDPRPDTEEQEGADRCGLQSFAGGEGNELIYLGLALRDESDHQQVIPIFSPEREQTLEYDIAKKLYALGNPQKKKVGILSSLDVMGGGEQPAFMRRQRPQEGPWAFVQELGNDFSVKSIEKDAGEIPKDIDLLLIIHPKELSLKTQYAIDQYVLKGGKAIVFVDPFSEADQASMAAMMNMQMAMQASFSSDLPRLFKAWGVQMMGAKEGEESPSPMGGGGPDVFGDPNLATKVQVQRGEVKNMIVWLSLTDKNCNEKEIITSGLDSLIMAYSGGLKKVTTSKDIEVTPLLTTTKEAASVDTMMLRMGGGDPDQLLKGFKPGSSEVMLACRITGKFKTAFPEGKPAETKPGENEEETSKTVADANQAMESKEPSTVIVVADADMLADRYSVRVQNFFGYKVATPLNNNLAFVSNAVENLTGSQDLIALRSRGKSQRPFTRVKDLEKQAQDQWLAQEESLDKKLKEADERLQELQKGTKEKRVLDSQLMAEVSKLRDERAKTREELRKVKRNLREGVERLGFKVKFINIALIPILVTAVSVVIAVIRSYRRKVAS